MADNDFPEGEPVAFPGDLAQEEPVSPQAPQSILDQIDREELSVHIQKLLRNDIADKEESDWKNRRVYDVNSYYGVKPKTSYPWPNASNFPVPLTPTLVDTAHSNILGSIFSDPQDTVQVNGVGPEDVTKAPKLESLLNWQLYEEIDAYSVMDKAITRSLTSPAGIVKVMQSALENKVVLESVSSDDIFLPLDARGFQIGETNHVFQIIPLDENDLDERKRLGVYEGIEDVPRGFGIRQGSLGEIVTQAKDVASGTKMDQRNRRDLYYIMECYLTYYWKPRDAAEKTPKVPVELIVWMAPNGGSVLRMKENKLRKRPYVAFIPYPRDDRFWGESLPEKIRYIQEELDYAHNQNINAADIAILPPMFFREGSSFDPEANKRVPGGAYPVPDSRDVTFQPIMVNPIFERQEDRYWDLAERLTGLTELFQGRQPMAKQTATLTIRRENRAEIRFKTLYQRYENSWSKLVDLIYVYDKEYMPKDKIVKVIGVTDQYMRVDQLFPQGMEGNYNFKFSSSPLTEKEYRKNSAVQLYEALVANPLVATSPANLWKITRKLAEALGEKNLEAIVTKPREANISSPEEAIQRIVSGETDFVPDPGIDADNYILRLTLFFKTDAFAVSNPKVKAALILLYLRAKAIRTGQVQMILDQLLAAGGPGGVLQQGGDPQNGNGQDRKAEAGPAVASK